MDRASREEGTDPSANFVDGIRERLGEVSEMELAEPTEPDDGEAARVRGVAEEAREAAQEVAEEAREERELARELRELAREAEEERELAGVERELDREEREVEREERELEREVAREVRELEREVRERREAVREARERREAVREALAAVTEGGARPTQEVMNLMIYRAVNPVNEDDDDDSSLDDHGDSGDDNEEEEDEEANNEDMEAMEARAARDAEMAEEGEIVMTDEGDMLDDDTDDDDIDEDDDDDDVSDDDSENDYNEFEDPHYNEQRRSVLRVASAIAAGPLDDWSAVKGAQVHEEAKYLVDNACSTYRLPSGNYELFPVITLFLWCIKNNGHHDSTVGSDRHPLERAPYYSNFSPLPFPATILSLLTCCLYPRPGAPFESSQSHPFHPPPITPACHAPGAATLSWLALARCCDTLVAGPGPVASTCAAESSASGSAPAFPQQPPLLSPPHSRSSPSSSPSSSSAGPPPPPPFFQEVICTVQRMVTLYSTARREVVAVTSLPSEPYSVDRFGDVVVAGCYGTVCLYLIRRELVKKTAGWSKDGAPELTTASHPAHHHHHHYQPQQQQRGVKGAAGAAAAEEEEEERVWFEAAGMVGGFESSLIGSSMCNSVRFGTVGNWVRMLVAHQNGYLYLFTLPPPFQPATARHVGRSDWVFGAQSLEDARQMALEARCRTSQEGLGSGEAAKDEGEGTRHAIVTAATATASATASAAPAAAATAAATAYGGDNAGLDLSVSAEGSEGRAASATAATAAATAYGGGSAGLDLSMGAEGSEGRAASATAAAVASAAAAAVVPAHYPAGSVPLSVKLNLRDLTTVDMPTSAPVTIRSAPAGGLVRTSARLVNAIGPFPMPLNFALVSPNGEWIAVIGDLAAVCVLDRASGFRVSGMASRRIPVASIGAAHGCQYLAWNPSSSLLAVSSDSLEAVYLWGVSRTSQPRASEAAAEPSPLKARPFTRASAAAAAAAAAQQLPSAATATAGSAAVPSAASAEAPAAPAVQLTPLVKLEQAFQSPPLALQFDCFNPHLLLVVERCRAVHAVDVRAPHARQQIQVHRQPSSEVEEQREDAREDGRWVVALEGLPTTAVPHAATAAAARAADDADAATAAAARAANAADAATAAAARAAAGGAGAAPAAGGTRAAAGAAAAAAGAAAAVAGAVSAAAGAARAVDGAGRAAGAAVAARATVGGVVGGMVDVAQDQLRRRLQQLEQLLQRRNQPPVSDVVGLAAYHHPGVLVSTETAVFQYPRMGAWSPGSHRLYPKRFKEVVRLLLMGHYATGQWDYSVAADSHSSQAQSDSHSSQAQSDSRYLWLLPLEVLLQIIGHAATPLCMWISDA
ncbi:unnamed protein product [Closterium sp. NIES-54]